MNRQPIRLNRFLFNFGSPPSTTTGTAGLALGTIILYDAAQVEHVLPKKITRNHAIGRMVIIRGPSLTTKSINNNPPSHKNNSDNIPYDNIPYTYLSQRRTLNVSFR